MSWVSLTTAEASFGRRGMAGMLLRPVGLSSLDLEVTGLRRGLVVGVEEDEAVGWRVGGWGIGAGLRAGGEERAGWSSSLCAS